MRLSGDLHVTCSTGCSCAASGSDAKATSASVAALSVASAPLLDGFRRCFCGQPDLNIGASGSSTGAASGDFFRLVPCHHENIHLPATAAAKTTAIPAIILPLPPEPLLNNGVDCSHGRLVPEVQILARSVLPLLFLVANEGQISSFPPAGRSQRPRHSRFRL